MVSASQPLCGPKSELTFGGQSTYILKVEGKKDAFIFMADIWRPEHPSDARYIWLPVQFKEGIPYVGSGLDNWDTWISFSNPWFENSLKGMENSAIVLFLTDYCIHLARFYPYGCQSDFLSLLSVKRDNRY